MTKQNQAEHSELGKHTEYDHSYNPKRLLAVARHDKRIEIGIDPNNLPFTGFDYWNHYETSWLNLKGKPVVATCEIYYDSSSPSIVESKSLKLYLNSLNNSVFSSANEVQQIISQDLENLIQTPVTVNIHPLGKSPLPAFQESFNGTCLDELDIECTEYQVNPEFLTTSDKKTEEILFSNLLKSNCLITNQPDWGSIQIIYKGKQINHSGLLRYLISYRNHNEFHEQCIERIFNDIFKLCSPEKLTVYGRYTRRGGLDINPYRSTEKNHPTGINTRLVRQ